MTSGLLSIRERSLKADSQEEEEAILKPLPNPYLIAPKPTGPRSLHEQEMQSTGGTYKYFLRGKHKKPSEEDYVVQSKRKPKLQKFEKFLRSFQYSAALDSSLADNMHPPTVIALLEELILRGDGLKIALSARDDASLEPIIVFIERYILNPRYTDVLGQAFDMILSMSISYTVRVRNLSSPHPTPPTPIPCRHLLLGGAHVAPHPLHLRTYPCQDPGGTHVPARNASSGRRHGHDPGVHRGHHDGWKG